MIKAEEEQKAVALSEEDLDLKEKFSEFDESSLSKVREIRSKFVKGYGSQKLIDELLGILLHASRSTTFALETSRNLILKWNRLWNKSTKESKKMS